MKLWKRFSDVLKDQNSIYRAKLARRTSFRNPELETAVIKATNHDECSIDYKYNKRIFSWIKTSPTFLKPVLWALATRMEKTRSWVVALKGLMLMHGIFCCDIPAVRKVGRLPFDLSDFNDARINSPKTWGFNAFVRAYFTFLDKKSALEAAQQEDENKRKESKLVVLLDYLDRLQALLDILLQIRPCNFGRKAILIVEAMDCITIEVFDIYSRICNGIAEVLVGIYDANKAEARMALRVLRKAASQGTELDSYFKFCREIGILNVSEFPKVEHVPEQDIRDLEQIVDRVTDKKNLKMFHNEAAKKVEVSRAIEAKKEVPRSLLKTVITDKWEVFEDEFKVDEGASVCSNNAIDNYTNPFVDSPSIPPLLCSYNNKHTYYNDLIHLEQ